VTIHLGYHVNDGEGDDETQTDSHRTDTEEEVDVVDPLQSDRPVDTAPRVGRGGGGGGGLARGYVSDLTLFRGHLLLEE